MDANTGLYSYVMAKQKKRRWANNYSFAISVRNYFEAKHRHREDDDFPHPRYCGIVYCYIQNILFNTLY